MSSNKNLKSEAIFLRKRGKSYNEIRKVLGIKSKGTLSYWFKKIELSKESKKLLEKNNKIAHERGLFIANGNRKIKIKSENKKAYTSGQDSIPFISKEKLLIVGTALYWAEGSKSEKLSNPCLAFSNSDPLMVAVYLRFIREILEIPEERIRAGIHIYPSISTESARKFWSNITYLPEDRFYIIRQVSRSSKGKRAYNTLPHGTVVIKINSRIQFYKVKGMIQGIVQKAKRVIL